VFQIRYYTSTNFLGFLFHFYLFFLRWKPVLVFLFNSFPLTCGAQMSVAMSAAAGIPLATRGSAYRSNHVWYKFPGVPTASVRSRRHPTSVSHRAPLPSPVLAAPHHLLPICAGALREEPPYHQSFDHLRRHDPLHSERRPEHPPLLPFSPGIATPEPLFLPTPTQDPAGHRSTHLIGERCHRPCFSAPSRRQEARVSCCLHPLVRRVVPPPWMLERPTSPHLSHGSIAAGHATTGARSTVTALVRARAPRAVPAGRPHRPWAGSANGPRAPLCRGHRLGHAPLCVGRWAGPSDVKSFSIFEWI
jgi:hypothetical protein